MTLIHRNVYRVLLLMERVLQIKMLAIFKIYIFDESTALLLFNTREVIDEDHSKIFESD